MFKKISGLLPFVLVMAMVITFSGCWHKNENNRQAQSGADYGETEIGRASVLIRPEGSRVNSCGQLVFYDRGEGGNPGFVIIGSDGQPVEGGRISFAGEVRAFTLDQKDNIYVLTTERLAGSSFSQKITVLTAQGVTVRTIDLGTFSSGEGNIWMGQGPGYTDLAVDASGNIILAHPEKGLQVMGEDGTPVKMLGDQGYASLDLDTDGNIIAVSVNVSGTGGLEKLSTTTGKSIWTAKLAGSNTGGVYLSGANKIRYSQTEQVIYHLTSQGVTKYDASGKLIGTAVDFKAYTLLASGYNVSDFCLDAAGNIYITTLAPPFASPGRATPVDSGAAPGARRYELFRYSPSSGEQTAEERKVITLAAPVSNRALEMAISKFQKEHPGFRIDLQTYTGDEQSGGDYDTYLKNLNTQILSGKGPDVISVAGLPYENYIAQNILVDLSAMMKNDPSFDPTKFYNNIFEAMKHNGKLYVLPTNFAFNVLMANQGILDQKGIIINDLIWTWEDFRQIAQQVTGAEAPGKSGALQRSALPFISSFELLTLFTAGSYGNYFNAARKEANFTSSEFIDLLTTTKAFSDQRLTDRNIQMDMVSILEAAGRETLVFYPYTITDYDMYGFMKEAFKEKLSLYRIPAAGGMFTSNSMYAINKNSKYKAESWEFLKTLLSDEVQSHVTQGMAQQRGEKGGNLSSIAANLFNGFSVNKNAQKQKAQQAMDAMQSGKARRSMMLKTPSGSIALSPAPLTPLDLDHINALIEGLDTFAKTDTQISSIIEDEIKAFFAGDKTAEETAQLIQERVGLYLGE